MAYVFNPFTGKLDFYKPVTDIWVDITGDTMTGLLTIQVPTTTTQALILKTTDDNTTKNLWEVQNSSAVVLDSVGATGIMTVAPKDAATTTVTGSLIIGHNTSGTPAAGFGTGLVFNGQDSTTVDQLMGRIRTSWITATHASRDPKMVLSLWSTTWGEQDVLTIGNNSSGRPYMDTGNGFFFNARFSAYAANSSGYAYGLYGFMDVAIDSTAIGLQGTIRLLQTSSSGSYTGMQGSLAVNGATGTLQGVQSSLSTTNDLNIGSGGNVLKFTGLNANGPQVRGSGTLGAGYSIYCGSPAIVSGTPTVTSLYGLYLENYVIAGVTCYSIYTNTGPVSLLGSNTIASAAGATWKGLELRAATATITGSTNITTATGFNYVDIAQPTLSGTASLTVTNAASLYIGGAPVAGGAGTVTITNPYALWIDAGVTRLDGNDVLNGTISTYNAVATEGYGVPAIPDLVSLTAQTADIASTGFTNCGVAGLYRVSYVLENTTADGTAGTVTLSLNWTDAAGTTATTASQGLIAVGRASGVAFSQVNSGTLTYSTTHTGNFGTAAYALYMIAERLN